MADQTQSEDAEAFFIAQGWEVQTIDGHSIEAVDQAVSVAKSQNNGKPKIILAKTIIAKGIPEVEGSAKGHGEGGAKFAQTAKKGLGLPESDFYVSMRYRNF